MLAVTNSGALIGVQAQAITIEVNSGERGELKYILVGLPDSAVKESQDRVLSALDNCGFQAPNTKTTINLAPGDLKKEGPSYDLPIALCLLSATQQIQTSKPDVNKILTQYLIAGELSLSGSIRPIKGGLALAQLAKRLNLKGILLPTK
jgi:magnesium chelatase family protein